MKLEQTIKLKPHPVNKTTAVSEKVYIYNEWKKLYYLDHLTLGHYLSSIFPEGDFLNLNCFYGVLAEALISDNRQVLPIDVHEDNYFELSEIIQNKFKSYDELSPSLVINKFTNVVSVDPLCYENDTEIYRYINFITRHSKENIFLLYYQLPKKMDLYLEYINEQGFYINEELQATVKIKLNSKLKIIKLDNLNIFRRKEIEYAWSSKNA